MHRPVLGSCQLRGTKRWFLLRSTSIASASRVNSSRTLRNFSSRPSSVASCWKSSAQTWLGCSALSLSAAVVDSPRRRRFLVLAGTRRPSSARSAAPACGSATSLRSTGGRGRGGSPSGGSRWRALAGDSSAPGHPLPPAGSGVVWSGSGRQPDTPDARRRRESGCRRPCRWANLVNVRIGAPQKSASGGSPFALEADRVLAAANRIRPSQGPPVPSQIIATELLRRWALPRTRRRRTGCGRRRLLHPLIHVLELIGATRRESAYKQASLHR